MERGNHRCGARWVRAAGAVIAFAALAPEGVSAGSIQMRLESAAGSVGIGETFDVAITADVAVPLLGFGFDLTFDEDLFGLTTISTGQDFFAARNAGASFFSAVAFPSPVIGEDILLGSATFTALEAGLGTFGIALGADDLTRGFAGRAVGVFLDYDVQMLEMLVTSPTGGGGGGGGGGPPVPEPATLALLAVGALAGARRRRVRTAFSA